MTENRPNFLTSEEEDSITDDIPEALRDTPEPVSTEQDSSSEVSLGGLWMGLGLLAIAIIGGIWISISNSNRSAVEVSSTDPQSASRATQSSATDPSNSSTNSSSSSPSGGSSSLSTDNSPEETDLLGHFAYEEAPLEELVAISADGSLRLRKMAAIKFRQMVNAAQRDGVSLVPLSAFRTLNDQEYLFFELKAQRGQVATERAEVSAPPGYSEHHTGYAVDIGDGYVPSVDFSESFENTAAFKWLEANAAYYSFELSFPRDNLQGIVYEPWHWRFVGDRHSLETFYKVQNGETGR